MTIAAAPALAASGAHALAASGAHALAASGAGTSTVSGLFWFLAVVSVAAAIGMVVARRAVHCAILLAAVMLSLAVLYALQDAPFLAFVQVIVYTGAVLMLFLFVLMLIGVSSAESLVETIKGQRLAAAIAGFGMVVLLAVTIGNAYIGPGKPMTTIGGSGNVTGIAKLVFTTYVWPFEVTSALLITAALAAMVLAHRERVAPKPTQREMSRRRIASGHPTPLPPPGVYALHNAVDMPALLPDGTAAEVSVSPVLSPRRELAEQTTGNGNRLPAPTAPTTPRDPGELQGTPSEGGQERTDS